MTRYQRQVAAVFIVAVLVRLLFHHLTGFIYDDAFITFRYAQNIATGNGFVYNVGERVLGTTTPLFTLILAALAYLGIPIVKGALLVSFLSSGVTAVILYRFAQSLGFARFSFIPATLYIFFPRLLVTDTGGMETPLFALLVTAAFYFQHKRLTFHAVTAAALASVTRPEGFLLLGILVVYNGVKDPKRAVSYVSVAAFITLPWLVFAYCYFGSPIPNSVVAKLALYGRLGTESFWENLVFLMGWHHPLGVPLFAFVLAGGWWLKEKQNFGLTEIVWMTGMVGSLAVSSTYLFLWYVTPIYPIYLLFVGAAFPFIGSRSEWLQRRAAAVARLVIAGMVLILAVANYPAVQSHRSYQKTVESVHRKIGQYLQTHAQEADIVAAEDIGYMGYYCGLKIIDRDGVVSPEVVPYNRSGNYLGLIIDYRPDWVVAGTDSRISTFLDSNLFLDHYRLRKLFRSASGREYGVFVRED